MNQSVFLSLEIQSVSIKNSSVIHCLYICLYIGIEAQLLSQVDIQSGVDVTFPMNESDTRFTVNSTVPNSAISMQTCQLNYILNSVYYRKISWTSFKYIFVQLFSSQYF